MSESHGDSSAENCASTPYAADGCEPSKSSSSTSHISENLNARFLDLRKQLLAKKKKNEDVDARFLELKHQLLERRNAMERARTSTGPTEEPGLEGDTLNTSSRWSSPSETPAARPHRAAITELQLSETEIKHRAEPSNKQQLAVAVPEQPEPEVVLAAVSTQPVPNPYPTKSIPSTVLEDEDYAEALDSIIERDYFPDLKRLRIESALLMAQNTNDFVTADRLQAKLENTFTTPSSSRAPDTPLSVSGVSSWNGTEFDGEGCSSMKKPHFAKLPSGQWIRLNTDVRLDKFHRKYTSKETAAFEALIIKDKKRRREKEEWIEDRERQHNKRVAVARAKTDTRDITIPDSLKNEVDMPVISTKHEARNSFIFPVLNIPTQQGEDLSSKPNVQFKNTRLPTSMQRADKLPDVLQKQHDKMLQKERDEIYNAALFCADEASNVNANGGSTPFQYAPKNDGSKSPPMTYGRISSTPQVIDCHDKYQFKMRDPTPRDLAAEQLEEKVKLKQREKVRKTAANRLKAFGITKNTPMSLLTPSSLAASNGSLHGGKSSPVGSLFLRNAQRAAKMIMRNATPRSSIGSSRASNGSQTPMRTPNILGSDLPKNITDGLLQ